MANDDDKRGTAAKKKSNDRTHRATANRGTAPEYLYIDEQPLMYVGTDPGDWGPVGVIDPRREAPREPNLGIGRASITEHDREFKGAQGAELRKTFQQAADASKVDAGLIAANLMDELEEKDSQLSKRGQILKRGATLETMIIGLDSYDEKQATIEGLVPAIKKVPKQRNIGMGHKWSYIFPAKAAPLMMAGYLRASEETVRDEFNRNRIRFDQLPPEVRFYFIRLGVNPGKTPVRRQVQQAAAKLHQGATPRSLLVQPASGTQRKDRPQTGAVIATARAIHLGHRFFGTEY